MPTTIYEAATAPYMKSFLIIGGRCTPCTDGQLDSVLRYTEDGKWEEMATKLDQKDYGLTAIPVPTEC